MSGTLVVFVEDARLLPDVSGSPDVLAICLDSQAASELEGRPGIRIRDVREYSRQRFASYDELYRHFEAEVREKLRPKNPVQQSRFLFDVFWDDILLNMIGIHYIECLIQEVLDRERPARVEFAIRDRELETIFRLTVQRRLS